MELFHFHPVIRIRLLLQFLTTMGTMAVIPFLIIFFSEQLGTFITGFLFIGVMSANIIGSAIGGFISDRIGRKSVILLSESIVCLGFLGAAFVNSPWYTYPYITFILFIFIQFSTGAATPVYQALIVDVSRPENRKTIYTYAYWLRNTAAAIGSMIGAFLFINYHFYLFIGVAGLTFISIIITSLFIKETYYPIRAKTKKRQTPLQMMKTYRYVLTNRFFIVLIIAAFLLVSVEEQLTNYIGVRLVNIIHEPVPLLPSLSLHIDGMNLVGLLKTTNTLIVVFCTVLIARIFKNCREKIILITGLCLFFFGYTMISYNTIPILLLLAMGAASIGEIMYAPIMQTMLANSIPDDKRSSYMAMYSIAAILGVSTAGVFLIISSWVPVIAMTLMIGLMGFISTGLIWKLTVSKEHIFGKNTVAAKLNEHVK